MSISWHFNEAQPGDRARESQVEKFFNSDDVANRANAIVREGIQNSLDAAPDDVTVNVRIAIGVWGDEEKSDRIGRYTVGFLDHFEAEAVRSKIGNPPGANDPFRYLVFEDFGTSGLLGEPDQWWPDQHGQANPFFNYFRGEGISDKSEGARGRHGVGRLVFTFASRIRSVFGLTRRNDGRQLLMGTSVLRNHWLDQKPYLPDGWFGIRSGDGKNHLTLPVENDPGFLSQFKQDFGVSRDDEQNGLSVIVPWLSADVTVSEIIRAVLSGYFYPILRRKLRVEVVNEAGESTVIDAGTIKSVIETRNGDLAVAMKPVLALAETSLTITDADRLNLSPPAVGAPRWSNGCMSDELRGAVHAKLEAGDVVGLRVPLQTRLKASNQTADCHFDIFLQRDPSAAEGQMIFIREGIIIADVRPRRASGVRAIIVIDEGPLAAFLGDAENPAHTQWQKELVRDKYSFHAATIDYVVHSVPEILRMLSEDQKKPDTALLIDLFSLPSDDDTGPKVKEKRKKKPGLDPDDPIIDLPKTPRRFVIDKAGNGFTVQRGDPDAERPPMLAIKVAYGVRRGSPFTKYNPADFRLGLGGVKCEFHGCESVDFDENWLLVQVHEDDFRVEVSGFDTNRDLHVDVKVKEKEVVDAAAA
ncbi:MAG: hypothetical protein WBD40_06520 [Tepidisphaeraceae bacterium]